MAGFIFIILVIAVLVLSELNYQKKLKLDDMEFNNLIYYYKYYYKNFSLSELKKNFYELNYKYSKIKDFVISVNRIPYYWKKHYYSELDEVDNIIANIKLEIICKLIVLSDLINQKEQSD